MDSKQQAMQIDLQAFAEFALDTFDCHPDFEDDEFAITFDGARIYVERKLSWFNIHLGREIVRLPRH